MQNTALQVASYFLAKGSTDGDITHLKLQKLISYAQAISLACLDRPLFEEDIEAWTHGPVVPSVYEEFKGNGNACIPPAYSEDCALAPFDSEQRLLLDLVNTFYRRYETWALRERSHFDFPGEFGSKKVISKTAMKEAFADNNLVKKYMAGRDVDFSGTGRELTLEEFANELAI